MCIVVHTRCLSRNSAVLSGTLLLVCYTYCLKLLDKIQRWTITACEQALEGCDQQPLALPSSKVGWARKRVGQKSVF